MRQKLGRNKLAFLLLCAHADLNRFEFEEALNLITAGELYTDVLVKISIMFMDLDQVEKVAGQLGLSKKVNPRNLTVTLADYYAVWMAYTTLLFIEAGGVNAKEALETLFRPRGLMLNVQKLCSRISGDERDARMKDLGLDDFGAYPWDK